MNKTFYWVVNIECAFYATCAPTKNVKQNFLCKGTQKHHRHSCHCMFNQPAGNSSPRLAIRRAAVVIRSSQAFLYLDKAKLAFPHYSCICANLTYFLWWCHFCHVFKIIIIIKLITQLLEGKVTGDVLRNLMEENKILDNTVKYNEQPVRCGLETVV